MIREKLLRELERHGWSIFGAPVILVRGGRLQIPDGVAYTDDNV